MGDDAAEVVESDSVTYRLETVRCGKEGCRTCPHGPYWYAYYRDGDKLRSRYIGRELPPDVRSTLGGGSAARSGD